MNLPEQLQKQVDEAKSILEQHYPASEAEVTAKAEGVAATAESKAELASPRDDEATRPVQADATAQLPNESDKAYEQRWRSLQGVYNSQSRELQQTKSRLGELEALVSTMQVQSRPSAAAAEVQSTFLTEKDSTEYGTDMVDFARRAAKEEVAPLVGAVLALREELARLQGIVPTVQNVAANQRVTAQERFFSAITADVPTWRATNDSPDFHSWLLTPDPMTGITRQTYLEDSQRRFDAVQAASIFRAWQQSSGATVTSISSKTKPNTAQSELEKQVSPGRSLSAAPPQSDKGRDWSPEDITKFYDESRRGLYKGREAERAATERDIFLAQRDGRIVRNAA